MNTKGMFYTNVSDYETKEDMMNDFIALRMYDMAKDKEIERLNKIIDNAIEYLTDEGVCILNKGMKENERLVWTWENYYDLLDILKGSDIE